MSEPPMHIVATGVFVQNRAGEILLVRTERRGWELPGGQVEACEDLPTAAAREVLEESGITVEIVQLLGVYTRAQPPAMVIFLFAATPTGGTLAPSNETPEVGWFLPAQALEMVTFPPARLRLADALSRPTRAVGRSYISEPWQVVHDAVF